jgi:hypothetical protein
VVERKKGVKSEEVKHVHTKSPHLLKIRVIWLFGTMWRERTTLVRRNDDGGKESIARIDASCLLGMERGAVLKSFVRLDTLHKICLRFAPAHRLVTSLTAARLPTKHEKMNPRQMSARPAARKLTGCLVCRNATRYIMQRIYHWG